MLAKRKPQSASIGQERCGLLHSRIGSILNKTTIKHKTLVAASVADRVFKVGEFLDPVFGCRLWPLNVGGSSVQGIQLVSTLILLIVTSDNLVIVNAQNKKVRFLIEKVKTPRNFIWKGDIGKR